MIVVLIILVVVFFCSACITGYLCLDAQEQRNIYYTRWKEANRLLEGADLDAIADGKPLLPRGKEKEHKTTPWGALEKRTHTQLTQQRLNQMSDYTRFQIERKRITEGLDPVDTLEGMSDYYTQRIIDLRLEEGWD